MRYLTSCDLIETLVTERVVRSLLSTPFDITTTSPLNALIYVLHLIIVCSPLLHGALGWIKILLPYPLHHGDSSILGYVAHKRLFLLKLYT